MLAGSTPLESIEMPELGATGSVGARRWGISIPSYEGPLRAQGRDDPVLVVPALAPGYSRFPARNEELGAQPSKAFMSFPSLSSLGSVPGTTSCSGQSPLD
jgi:hypothetical protein